MNYNLFSCIINIKLCSNSNNMEESIGFIILRHINSHDTDKLWKTAYEHIRKIWKDHRVMIIDDNSKYQFVDTEYEKKLHNCTIIKGEYPGRGEVLPYIYYLKNKFCDKACIIHDGCFINKDFLSNDFVKNLKSFLKLWTFCHSISDKPEDEVSILRRLNDERALTNLYYNKSKWCGMYGGMCIIKHDFLVKVNERHDLIKLTDGIKNRYNRMSFERVIAVILTLNDEQKKWYYASFFGDIHKYCPWGVTLADADKWKHLPVTKIWCGR